MPERRAQQLIAASFFLLAAYITVEAIRHADQRPPKPRLGKSRKANANGPPRDTFHRLMSSFDEYLATVPDPQRAELERIRQVVRRTVPDAEEATSYGMPAFKYKKRPLLGCRVSKNHLSVFPFSPEAVDAARGALDGFDLSKGTVRFTPETPIPETALEQLLRHRLREIEGE